MRLIQTILVAGVISAVVFFAIALGLIFSQTAQYRSPESASLDFKSSIAADYRTLPALRPFKARDGAELGYRHYAPAAPTGLVLILVHGSGWHGMQFHQMASALAAEGFADVIVPDLRGHGPRPQRRGDVDYIGQLEDDLADLIGLLKTRDPGKKIVLGGHSIGGGLVIRFAGGAHRDLADAFLLLAPFLKYDAPTTRPYSGGWANPATRRIIGLSMLNTVGIHALDDLPAISFSVPGAVMKGPLGNTATPVYSFRMLTSLSPRSDYRADLRAIDKPFLLVAGEADEAFFAAQYEKVITAETRTGQYRILPGVNHLGLMQDRGAFEAIGAWLKALADTRP